MKMMRLAYSPTPPSGADAIREPVDPTPGTPTARRIQRPPVCAGTYWLLVVYLVMKPTPSISEKKSAIVIWIGAAIFTIGAMIFGR
jgi:hypothetical protein